MRLLLDAHVSGHRIGAALGAEGHDVRAVDQERGLEGWSDERLLTLAESEGRIVVTFDVADFARISQNWAGEGRSHSGLILVTSLDHSEFGAVLRVIGRALASRSDQAAWRNHTVFVGRGR